MCSDARWYADAASRSFILRKLPVLLAMAVVVGLYFALDRGAPGDEDPAAGLPHPVLAATLRTWDFPGSRGPAAAKLRASYFDGLVETARRFIREKNGSVLVLPQVRGPWPYEDDRIISRRFADALAARADPSRVRMAEVPEAALPSRMIGILGRADAVLATRLHSAIFALLAGRVPVVIGYQPKSAGTMDLLGLGAFCRDIDRIDPGALAELIGRSLEPGAAADEIRARVAAAGAEVKGRIGAALREFAGGTR